MVETTQHQVWSDGFRVQALGFQEVRFGVFQIPVAHLQLGQIHIAFRALWRHFHGVIGLLECVGGVAQRGVGIGEEELRVDVAGIGFEDQLGAVFRFLLMSAGKLQPAKFHLRFPVVRLEFDGALKFLKCRGPAHQLELCLRELEVSFGVARIELDGAAVVDQCLRIFSLVKTRVSFGQKFLRVSIAAGTENQKEEKQRSRH
jgi:hypothetical protein